MKLKIFILIFFSVNFYGQNVSSIYLNYFASNIKLNPDSTFYSTTRNHNGASWTQGKWKMNKNVVQLFPVIVYDTIKVVGKKNKIEFDSLVISKDKKPERLEKISLAKLFSGEQNSIKIPEKFIFKKNRLYKINSKGKIDNTKEKSLIGKKKYPTYYFRSDDRRS